MLDCAGVLEPKLAVKRDTGGIFDVDTADHDMPLVGARRLNELVHQRVPEALPPVFGLQVHRVFDRILVGRPARKVP